MMWSCEVELEDGFGFAGDAGKLGAAAASGDLPASCAIGDVACGAAECTGVSVVLTAALAVLFLEAPPPILSNRCGRRATV